MGAHRRICPGSLRLDNGFNEGFEFWIPKSQVNALTRLDEKRSVKLDITAWWLRKKLEEFEQRVYEEFIGPLIGEDTAEKGIFIK